MKRRSFLSLFLAFLAKRDRNGAVLRFLQWRIRRILRRTSYQFAFLSESTERLREATVQFNELAQELSEGLAPEEVPETA